jgi:hypothetical protein
MSFDGRAALAWPNTTRRHLRKIGSRSSINAARLSSLGSPDAHAVPAFHVGAPRSATETPRNLSRRDARVRAHVAGGAHRAIARNAAREGTGRAGNLNDPINHLYCASVSGLTRPGLCPKHSAPRTVEFARGICARRGNHRRDARARDQQTSSMASHVDPIPSVA